MILSIVFLALIGLFAFIGLIVGAVKGFTRVKSWAVELVLSGTISIAVSRLFSGIGGLLGGLLALAVSIAVICIMMLLFAIFRKSLTKRIEKRKQLSYYKQYDEIEDNTEQILNALGTEDKKQYKKLTRKKFKQSGGSWSVVDKIFGALVLMIKGAVMAGIVGAFVLTVLDFSTMAAPSGGLYGAVGAVYESSIWLFFKNYIFDFFVIGILTMCIKSGYSHGITTSLWSLFVIALVVGAAVLSFSLAFNNGDFIAAAEKFDGKLSESLSGVSGILEMVGMTTLTVAKIIIGLIMFILLLVVIILIAKFVPRLIDRARESVIFSGVDGVLGAIMLTVLIVAIFLLIGAVANSMHDAQFMKVFNAYFEKSGIATYFYDNNLINAVGILSDLPMKEWFK